MGFSTAGVIGAVIAMVLTVLCYVSPRAAFRQRVAQFDPAEGEKQREMLRRGQEHWKGWWGSSWAQLPMSMIAAAFAGYLVGRLFD
jgi:hypothetical protein